LPEPPVWQDHSDSFISAQRRPVTVVGHRLRPA
jgi:hypothetical protein